MLFLYLSAALCYKYRIETSDGHELIDINNEMLIAATSFVAAVEARFIAKCLYGGRQQRSKADGLGGGSMPYGYTRSTTGKIAINPGEQKVIHTILTPLAANIPYRKISDHLNKAGCRTAKGTPWTPGSVEATSRHETFYKTGVKQCGKVEAYQKWPVILEEV